MTNDHQTRNSNRNNGSQYVVTSRRFRHGAALSQRTRGLQKNQKDPFTPPEDWHEPRESDKHVVSYRFVVQDPGPGFRHPVTPKEVRQRLSQLPEKMLEPLEVIQLSRMTRKKRSLPCYGMQWGATLYLYPIEQGMVEYYARPPKPAQVMEAKMFGGRWRQTATDEWELAWTKESIKDFYLNNILIHELGHLLDDRNSSYSDRERFAEWFAIEHGYKKRKGSKRRSLRPKRKIIRRHHSS